MEKFLTKENLIIAIAAFVMIIQSNYFATKLDVSDLKLEMAEIKSEMKDYSDKGDKELIGEIDKKIQGISDKLDKLK